MPLKERPWYPWASGAGWGLLVLALTFVNTGGNLPLALALATAVAVISHHLARKRGSAEQ